MALIITVADLKTHFYSENIGEISRSDTTIIQEAIDTAIAEAKAFLGKYELPALFGTSTQNPTVNDANLRSKVKDLARWHLILLANPNIDYADAEKRYKYAIDDYFKAIMTGKMEPEGWPYHDSSTDPAPAKGNEIAYSSNPKRSNHY